MLRSLLFVFLSFSCTSVSLLPRTSQDNVKNTSTRFRTADMISAAGYLAETYQVTTSDGYILTMHRIPYSYTEVKVVPVSVDKPVVFLMHGLTSASHAFVALNRELAIGYNLADAGFDVWMGNARGNSFSRNHESLDPDHETEKYQFFDFTWEEIGAIDLPTMIDFVLNATERERLHYIGHSQGGTSFLVLNSLRPDYNIKFLSAHLLAGVGYMEYFPNEEMLELAQNTDLLYNLALLNGLVELSPATRSSNFTRTICLADPALENMCNVLQRNHVIHTQSDNDDETSFIEDIFAGMGGTAGAAIKQYAHYGQNVQSKLFRRWDYGAALNPEVYGTEEPPLYDISLITVNTTMHYTVGDDLLDERDVLNMVADMANCVARRVARDTFGHSDFVIASDAKELVTDYIIDHINDIENRIAEAATVTEEEETEANSNELEVNVPGETVVIEAAVVDENNSASVLNAGVVLKISIVIYGVGAFLI